MRAIRFFLGLFVIIQGIQTKEWLFLVLGALFALMSILNIGCCGSSTCNIPNSKKSKNAEDINYDEVL